MSRTVNFDCGCFVQFAIIEGALQEMLACCVNHEEPHQSLENLARTHDFSIERKYVEPVKRPNRGIDYAREKHPELQVEEQEWGRVLRFEVDGVYIETFHPNHQSPQHFWFHQKDLELLRGNWMIGSDSPAWKSKLNLVCSFHPYSWNPNRDDAFIWIKLIEIAVRRVVKRNIAQQSRAARKEGEE
jgi:hypothetical protein